MNKRIVSYLFLVLLLLTLMPVAIKPVGAYSSSTFAVTGNGYHIGLQSTDPGNDWDQIDQYPTIGLNIRNGGTTYCYDTFVVADHTTQTGKIANVTVVSFCSNESGVVGSTAFAKHNIYIGGSLYNGSEFQIIAPGNHLTAKYYNTSWTTDPSTSLPWTWAAIDNAQYGIGIRSGTFGVLGLCYYLYMKVYYLPIPNPPSLPKATGTENNITVSWTNYSNPVGSTRYTMVRYDTLAYPTTITQGTLLINTTTTNTTKIYSYTSGTYYLSFWTYIYQGTTKVWSTSYNTTSITVTRPTNLASYPYNDTRINLTWTKGTGDTVVVRNNSGWAKYPLTPSNGTKIYNGSLALYQDTGLRASKKYYYRAWNWNGTSYSSGYTNISQYTRPQVPLNVAFKVGNVGAVSYINITWTNGSGVKKTTVRESITAQPSTPQQGAEGYNGTNKYYNKTVILHPWYFTMYSWNTTTGLFSTASPVSWYCVWVNVYNETSGVALTNWDIFITNATGTQTYTKTGCSNPTLINVSLLPKGAGCTIQVSKTTYTTRVTTADIVITGNYYINSYLAHFLPPEIPPTNTSYLYLVSVINEQLLPVSGCLLTVKRVVSGSYVAVTSGLTDGNGQFSCYLVPGGFYKFFLTKTGYQDGVSDWTPSDALFTNTFKIYYALPTNETDYYFLEEIHITASMDNATSLITVTYVDDLSNTTNLQIYIYDVTLNYTLVHTSSTVGTSSVTTTHVGNNTHDYEVVYKMNHSYFNYQSGALFINGYHKTLTTQKRFNLLFAINFGYNPFGWSNFIVWILMVGVFFLPNRRDTFIAMFIGGFLLLFINLYIGFNTTLSAVAGGGIPIIMIFFGILMLIRDRTRFSNDM